jgi:hypothetical protein
MLAESSSDIPGLSRSRLAGPHEVRIKKQWVMQREQQILTLPFSQALMEEHGRFGPKRQDSRA